MRVREKKLANLRTARSGSHVFGCAVERDGFEAFRIVWAGGTEDNEKKSLVGGTDTDSLLSTDYC